MTDLEVGHRRGTALASDIDEEVREAKTNLHALR